jgi:hypothetical protein
LKKLSQSTSSLVVERNHGTTVNLELKYFLDMRGIKHFLIVTFYSNTFKSFKSI